MDKSFHKLKEKLTPSFLLFLTIIIFSLIPRIIVFLTKEEYFTGDFAFYYFNAKEIVLNHNLPLIGHVVGDIGGFAQGAGWNYLLAIPFALFNGDPFGGKVLMLIVSFTTLILGLYTAWHLIGKREGIFIGFLLGTSQYLIMWTNDVWPPYIIPLLTILYLSALALFLSKNKRKHFILMSIVLGIMAHFEIASLGLLFPSYLLLIAYLFLKNKITKKDISLSFLTFIVFFVPHAIYDISHNFYNTRGILSLLLHHTNNTDNKFLLIITDRLHLFLTDFIEVFPISNIKLLIFIFLFLIFGLFLYARDERIKKWKKIFTSYIFISIPLTFFGLCLIPVERASFWWITYLTIFYVFFAGIILSFFLFYKGYLYKLAVILIITLFLYASIINLSVILNKQKELKPTQYLIRIQEPIEWIYTDSKDEQFNVLYITGLEKILDYKFMFWYVGKNEYRNSQALKSLDLQFTTSGGMPTYINEKTQFKNLKKGIYYIIITNQSLQNGYASKILKNKLLGKIISVKHIGNEPDGFEIRKIFIDNPKM